MTLLDDTVWFTGPVKDAITLVSQRNCVFLVYIYDDSEKTSTLNATLNEENVARIIKEETVGLAMKKDSENATMFGQFYPIQAVPILYFIKGGTIRDFGIETITGEEIIDKVKAVNGVNTTTQPIAVTPPAIQPDATPSLATTAEVTSNQNTTVFTNDTNSHPKESTQEEENAAKAAKKAELLKQLEKARKEREEREKKEAKERELKRREDAKMMQEAKQHHETRENKIYFDKIKKERKEDEEHRKRVREQIARDRAEKIAQRNAERQRQNSQSSTVQTTSSSSSKNYDVSNLNIRQLDGSNIRHQFEGSTTLSNVRDWIKENRTDENKAPYKLSSQFPNRIFTEADDQTTLKELGLCPSATMIMKPIKTGQVSHQTGVVGSVQSIYNSIYGFIVGLLVMFNNFLTALFPTNGIANYEPQQPTQQQPNFKNLGEGQRLGGEGISSSTASASSSNNVQKRNPYATRINTIHDDSDDENDKKRPTYNGNSVNHE